MSSGTKDARDNPPGLTPKRLKPTPILCDKGLLPGLLVNLKPTILFSFVKILEYQMSIQNAHGQQETAA